MSIALRLIVLAEVLGEDFCHPCEYIDCLPAQKTDRYNCRCARTHVPDQCCDKRQYIRKQGVSIRRM